MGLLVVAVIVALVWIRKDQKRQIRHALQNTELSLKEHSRREAEVLTRSARMLTREETNRLRGEIENAIGAESEEIRQREKRLEERESLLDRQLQSLLENEKQLNQKQDALNQLESDLGEKQETAAQLIEKHKQALAELAGLGAEEAKDRLFEIIGDATKMEAGQISRPSSTTRRIMRRKRRGGSSGCRYRSSSSPFASLSCAALAFYCLLRLRPPPNPVATL